MDNELKSKAALGCEIAENFINQYYQSFDKRRHTMGRLYSDNAIFVWNGNGVNNKDIIQSYFLEELPASDHRVTTLDVQPIHTEITGGQVSYLVQVGGTVKYAGHNDQPFHQTFIITAQDNEWKISNDCYRFQDILN